MQSSNTYSEASKRIIKDRKNRFALTTKSRFINSPQTTTTTDPKNSYFSDKKYSMMITHNTTEQGRNEK